MNRAVEVEITAWPVVKGDAMYLGVTVRGHGWARFRMVCVPITRLPILQILKARTEYGAQEEAQEDLPLF